MACALWACRPVVVRSGRSWSRVLLADETLMMCGGGGSSVPSQARPMVVGMSRTQASTGELPTRSRRGRLVGREVTVEPDRADEAGAGPDTANGVADGPARCDRPPARTSRRAHRRACRLPHDLRGALGRRPPNGRPYRPSDPDARGPQGHGRERERRRGHRRSLASAHRQAAAPLRLPGAEGSSRGVPPSRRQEGTPAARTRSGCGSYRSRACMALRGRDRPRAPTRSAVATSACGHTS